MILENKFERYRGNARADQRVEQVLEEHNPKDRILVLPEFIPCQKALAETEIAFVIFPSNRGGYCIQPQKREYSMNYKCKFSVAMARTRRRRAGKRDRIKQCSLLSQRRFSHDGWRTGRRESSMQKGT